MAMSNGGKRQTEACTRHGNLVFLAQCSLSPPQTSTGHLPALAMSIDSTAKLVVILWRQEQRQGQMQGMLRLHRTLGSAGMELGPVFPKVHPKHNSKYHMQLTRCGYVKAGLLCKTTIQTSPTCTEGMWLGQHFRCIRLRNLC
eukprot:3611856-Amphidinium_carterae.1